MLTRRRVAGALIPAAILGVLISAGFTQPTWQVVLRAMAIGTGALLAFSLLERWPRRLPRWLARWALQVAGVAASIPPTVLLMYLFVSRHDAVPLYENGDRLAGMTMLTVTGLLFAPWIAVTALFRQREVAAREQALAFELERSELARAAGDARLRLVQAQVQPHFLFNTLANVRELVDAGSPQAAHVLEQLIAYLRAAVPRLDDGVATLALEAERVRAYLELMRMRMPDRLQYALDIDADALSLYCPPMSLLTLVENAVRHGIDPSEDGGHISVRVILRQGRCQAEVSDSGVGLRGGSGGLGTGGLGTGLKALHERLKLAFGDDASLQLAPLHPSGTRASLDFPASDRSP